MIKLLHIATGAPDIKLVNKTFLAELHRLGQLTIVENAGQMPEAEHVALIRGCDILITSHGTVAVPTSLAADRGSLKYICHLTGTLRRWIPLELIDAGIPVTNWGPAPAIGVAEGALALLLGCLKGLHLRIQTVRSGGWRPPEHMTGGFLQGLNVGIYGCGAIGRHFVNLLRPFDCTIRVFDPLAESLPEDCIRVDSLDELFSRSEAIVIHAALTDETRGSVTAELLAKLPRHGVVVNTARGGIIDQGALFAELERGRLRAGLDVLEPDYLPPEHPARTWENLILTAHRVEAPWPDPDNAHLMPMHHVCLDNLRRFLNGEPLQFVMDRRRYLLST